MYSDYIGAARRSSTLWLPVKLAFDMYSDYNLRGEEEEHRLRGQGMLIRRLRRPWIIEVLFDMYSDDIGAARHASTSPSSPASRAAISGQAYAGTSPRTRTSSSTPPLQPLTRRRAAPSSARRS
jgi:hypothetical protein